MNNALINNWNKVVGDDDTVYLLGDIGMGKKWEIVKCLYDLKGKIHWITGNHDKKALKWPDLARRFESIEPYKEILIEDENADYRGKKAQMIVLFHYPIVSWNGMYHNSWQLYGHCHSTYYNSNNKQVDVGVDVDIWNYTPVSYLQLKEYMSNRPFIPVDGQGKKSHKNVQLRNSRRIPLRNKSLDT